MTPTLAFFAISAVTCYGLLYILMWHWRRRRLYKLASQFKGPPVLPVLGNAHLLANTERILNVFNQLHSSYSSPFRLWFGPSLWVIVTDPEHVKTVCLSPKTLEKGKVFVDYCRPLLNTGLATAPVSMWELHRKLIHPTFNVNILDSFFEVFAAQSKILTKQMGRNLDGPDFKIFELVSSCTLDMVCETTMGVTVKAQTDQNCYYVEAVRVLLACFRERLFSIWLHPDIIFRLSKVGRDERKYIKFFDDFINDIIQIKKKKLSERNNQPTTTADKDDRCKSTPGRKAFLDHLMTVPNSSTVFSDRALRDEVATMVVAGNETTAGTLSFAMLMLASYPDVQEKVCQELYEIYGDDDIDKHPITSKDLSQMKYLERVIKETLRLFPAAPFIIREVTDDLDIGDYTLPNGSSVAIGIITIHRSEKYWQDPLKFDPDRFLPEEISKRHPYTFMAFSGGLRNCIGYRYAMMSMKVVLATVLRKFILKTDNVLPVKDIRLQMDITLQPVDPIKLRIERRTRH